MIDPRPIELPFAAVRLPLSPERLPELLKALPEGKFDGFSRQEASILTGIAARLAAAKRPVLIGGGDLLGAPGVEALLAAARALSRPERPCGAAVLLAGPNSYGGALLAADGPDFAALLDGIEAGRIKALVCLESDPFGDYPDPARAQRALARLELLLVLDYLPTVAAARADIFLPTTVPAEGAGTFVNHEGRMLASAAVFDPGTPIRATGGGDHPPRVFAAFTPGSLPRPAWSVLAALLGGAEEQPALEQVRQELAAADPRFAGVAGLAAESEGRRVCRRAAGGGCALPPRADRRPDDSLRLLAVENLFGSEIIAAFSPVLDPVRPAPHLWLHADDAARLGLVAGATARLSTEAGAVEATVRLSAAMAPGVVVVPRLRGTPLEDFVPGGGWRACRVEKGGAP